MRRVAVVGAGYFAGFQIAAWQRIAGAELVAIVEPDAERRAAALKAAPGARGYADLGALLGSDTADLIDIATPPATHESLVTLCLNANLPVICQKPFGSDLDTAKRLRDLSLSLDTPLIVHENFRFQPWYREIRNLLTQGTLGHLVQARFSLRPGDGAGLDAYLSRQPYFRQMPRFLIRETGIHFIDTFRFLFGPPRAVYADLRTMNPVIAGEDSGIAIFDYDAGSRAIFDGDRTLDHAAQNHRLTMGEFQLEGSEGELRLTGDGAIRLRPRGAQDWRAHSYHWQDRDFGGNCVENFQRHVIDGLAGQRPLETLAEDYIANLEVEAALYASAESGAKQVLA
ncbi:Gfo/Idh/MocA family protein [Oceanibium sediminis]|uniref:Gfo/Idh/MocA family protein n=1 Tax=Oceanibium sediminis TaxID=2026339 RepID=UPI000DD34D32|nr:Gfo/Idh/MocA family oxidoreductase [Oceanibium sediminis]